MLAIAVLAITMVLPSHAIENLQGVYQYVVQNSALSFDEAAIKRAIGWE